MLVCLRVLLLAGEYPSMHRFLNQITVWFPALALGASAGGILLAHAGIIPPRAGEALYVLGGVLGLLALVAAGAAIAVTRAWPRILFALLGLLPLITVTGGVILHFTQAPFPDLATDAENPPPFSASTTGQAPVQAATPLELPLGLEEAFARAKRAAEEMKGWHITSTAPATHTFEAATFTKVFRWPQQVAVRVTPMADGSRVDVRVRILGTTHDHGANRKTLQRFLDRLGLQAPE